jgi:hypothetical protein
MLVSQWRVNPEANVSRGYVALPGAIVTTLKENLEIGSCGQTALRVDAKLRAQEAGVSAGVSA